MCRFLHALFAVILSVAALPAWGQSFSGKIVGLVTDSSTAVIPNVAVTVVNEGTGAQRRLITDSAGIYVAAELPVGYYTVQFDLSGLARTERSGVKVDVGGETRADISLGAQVLRQSVEIRAAAPALQQDSSALVEVVDTRQVEQLPLNGRDFRKLAFLLPSAAPRSSRGVRAQFRSCGQYSLEIGHERVARNAVRVPAQRQTERA